MLGVHHRNVCVDIVRQALMCDSGVPLWTLTLKRREVMAFYHLLEMLLWIGGQQKLK